MIKKFIIIILLLIYLPSFSEAAVFYVDCNADAGGDGTTSATTGANCAWDTVADVNAASFSAGDSILFNKGCTWREQLTVPSSGNAGSPITFGAYGTGDDSIISGGELITTWAAIPGDEYNYNFDDNDISAWTVSKSASASVTASGGKVITTTVATATWARLYKTGTARTEYWWSCKFNPNSLTMPAESDTVSGFGLTTGGETEIQVIGITVSGGFKKWRMYDRTDAAQTLTTLPYLVTQGTDYIIVGHWKASTAPGANNGISQIWINGILVHNLSNIDSDTKTANGITVGDLYTAGGATLGATLYFDNVSLGTTVCGYNYWGATLATVPIVVSVDGTRKTNWIHIAATNMIYLYDAAADPDTYVAPGVESGVRNYGINLNGKNYITIDGLNIQLSNGNWPGGGIGVGSANATGVTIQNCTLQNNKNGIEFYNGTGDTNTIQHNTIYGSLFGINMQQFNCSSGHETTIHGNTIYSNLNDGINVRGNYYIIDGNEVHDNGVGNSTSDDYLAIHIYSGGVGEGTGDYNIVRYNKVYNQVGSVATGGTGIGIDQWCDNNEVYYNIVYNNAGAGIGCYNAQSLNIYNNTCYGNGATGLYSAIAEISIASSVSDLTANVNVKNNIGYARAGEYAIYIDALTANNAGISITNNDWYINSGNWYSASGTPGATLATWNAISYVGTDLNADPLFVNAAGGDFRLQTGSPAINAGVDVGLTTDYAGNTLLGYPDMGAYEYFGLSLELLMLILEE